MNPYKTDFNRAAAAVTIPASDIEKIIWSDAALFKKDNDFTDYVFLNNGVGRINHLFSKTFIALSHPREVFELGAVHKFDTPPSLPASAGVFVSAFITPFSRQHGLAFLVRDRIKEVSETRPDSHLVAGFSAIYNAADKNYRVSRLSLATLNQEGRVNGYYNLPITPENAKKTLLMADLCIRQIMSGERLTLQHNLWQVEHGAEILDNPAPKP